MTKWQKAWVDMFIYVSLGVLNAAALWLDKLGEIALEEIKWYSWVGLFIGAGNAAMLAIKSTMSQSWETDKDKKEVEVVSSVPLK